MSNYSLFVTFWTGAAIMFIAFCLAFYFSRQHRTLGAPTSQTAQ
jgi:hypothetical protein